MKQNLQRYAHGYKINNKVSTKPLSSCYASFLFSDIDSSDLLGAAHGFHHTFSLMTAQKSCHVAVDEFYCNHLASLTIANQWNFTYLGGKMWRKNLTCYKKSDCNFGISMPILVLTSIKLQLNRKLQIVYQCYLNPFKYIHRKTQLLLVSFRNQ